MNQEAEARAGLKRLIVASIGPTTSEELRQEGIQIDLEAPSKDGVPRQGSGGTQR
jgi:uroporphyrinogen-III synthase